MTAVARQDHTAMKLLLLLGASPDAQEHPASSSVLMAAAFMGDLESVEILVTAGANIDLEEDSMGYSALSLAAGAGHTDIVSYLLDKGARKDCRLCDGLVAYAVSGNSVECVKLLLSHGFRPSSECVYYATQKDNPEMIRMLVSEGVPINKLNHLQQMTPLIRAVTLYKHGEIKDTRTIETLLELGADKSIRSQNRDLPNLTAAEFAEQEGLTELLPLLTPDE